jgi:hypothetical protein
MSNGKIIFLFDEVNMEGFYDLVTHSIVETVHLGSVAVADHNAFEALIL